MKESCLWLLLKQRLALSLSCMYKKKSKTLHLCWVQYLYYICSKQHSDCEMVSKREAASQKHRCLRKTYSKQIPHTLSDTHLEFHLLSLLGVNSHNMLVMPERMSAVLLLCSHVTFQSLQHAIWLEAKVKQRIKSGNDCDKEIMYLGISTTWETYMGGLRLYGSQVVLQGQAAVVVKNGLDSDKMSLHQPLPLSSDLLLQRLQHRLEVLVEKRGRVKQLWTQSLIISYFRGNIQQLNKVD